jgi:hypothetical protein
MPLTRSTPRILDATSDAEETSGTNTTTYTTSTKASLVIPVGVWIVEVFAKVTAGNNGTPSSSSVKTAPSFSGTSAMGSITLMSGYSSNEYINPATLAMSENGSRIWNFDNLANFGGNRGVIDYRRFKASVTASGTMAIQFAPAAAVASQFARLLYGSYIKATSVS